MSLFLAIWENQDGVHRKYYESRIGAFRATRQKSTPLWASITEVKQPQSKYQIVKLLNKEVAACSSLKSSTEQQGSSSG